jgi:hypothetical protein
MWEILLTKDKNGRMYFLKQLSLRGKHNIGNNDNENLNFILYRVGHVIREVSRPLT